jgi:hypothetical protein
VWIVGFAGKYYFYAIYSIEAWTARDALHNVTQMQRVLNKPKYRLNSIPNPLMLNSSQRNRIKKWDCKTDQKWE